MVNKISFLKIFSSHFNSMRNDATGRISWGDIFVFFGIPLAVSFITLSQLNFNKDFLNSIITSGSIFAGLLLNLLVLIYTLVTKFNTEEVNWPQKKILLEQTFANISFCILVSILLVVCCMLAFRADEDMKTITLSKNIADSIVCYLTCVLSVHLLMVLKRIHTLIDSEM